MGDGDRFAAQDRRPATVESADVSQLSPRARALLFLPDLVTDFLETTFGERIAVTCLSQSCQTDVVDPELGARLGDSVVVRESLIRGARSDRPFIHAEVRLAASNVPADLVTDLEDLSSGLGRLLDKHGVVCEREMLWYGVEKDEAVTRDLRKFLGGEMFLARCYRLVSEGVVIAALVERFSVDLFDKED